jgi:uncharacterized protein (TIGR02328 family)
MRIWHKHLISVLPKNVLSTQWLELSAAAKHIKEEGKINNLLVNFINDYDLNHFISYADLVRKELIARGEEPSYAIWGKITGLKYNWEQISYEDIYKEKMNSDYYIICYYNLYERYLCGGLTEEEWNLIINNT